FGQPSAAHLRQHAVNLGERLLGAGARLAQDGLAFFAMHACAVAATYQIGCGQDDCPHLVAWRERGQAIGKLVADLAGMWVGVMAGTLLSHAARLLLRSCPKPRVYRAYDARAAIASAGRTTPCPQRLSGRRSLPPGCCAVS